MTMRMFKVTREYMVVADCEAAALHAVEMDPSGFDCDDRADAVPGNAPNGLGAWEASFKAMNIGEKRFKNYVCVHDGVAWWTDGAVMLRATPAVEGLPTPKEFRIADAVAFRGVPIEWKDDVDVCRTPTKSGASGRYRVDAQYVDLVTAVYPDAVWTGMDLGNIMDPVHATVPGLGLVAVAMQVKAP